MPPLVFFGSSAFSIPALKTLLDHQISPILVITTPDKPAGRHLKLTPNPLKKFALENHLSVSEDFSQIPQGSVGLVAAYGKIIPQSVLDTFNSQIFNIHPSLLPKYRGPSPLQFQILDGLTTSGVTVFQLDAKMDRGPIVGQITETLHPDDTPESLGTRLFVKGTELFLTCDLKNTTPQDESQASYTKKLTRDHGFVPYKEFKTQILHPSPEFKRKFQAFSPWPGIWTTDPQNQRLKLLQLSPLRVFP